jgi:hypothetical protein
MIFDCTLHERYRFLTKILTFAFWGDTVRTHLLYT